MGDVDTISGVSDFQHRITASVESLILFLMWKWDNKVNFCSFYSVVDRSFRVPVLASGFQPRPSLGFAEKAPQNLGPAQVGVLFVTNSRAHNW